MEAMRVIKTVESNVLHELDKYMGKKVEIIIISDGEKNSREDKKWNLKKFYGSSPDMGDGLEIQNRLRNEWAD